MLMAAIISGFVMGFGPLQMLRQYGKTLYKVRFSLITIAAMMSIGFMTRYGGLDATMGLAFARTGTFYPFFGTLLGWLGVALTGSDTASNVLFGSLQKISATQVGLSPTLMAAANSCGGVMGKMIDAQSIVVASTATEWYGHEGDILRYVFFHSIALASLWESWYSCRLTSFRSPNWSYTKPDGPQVPQACVASFGGANLKRNATSFRGRAVLFFLRTQRWVILSTNCELL